MKKYAKWLFVMIALISFSSLFAQHGRYERRYFDHRYEYAYRPTYSYRPYYSYAPLRTSVSVIASLPFGAVDVTFGGRPYHYYDGVFYSPMTGGYMIVEPPMGIVVPVLPPNAISIMIGGRNYFHFGGVFYIPLGNNQYQVVQKPEEKSDATNDKAKASDNSGYEKIVLEGKTYYKKGNKYYKASVNDNGEVTYQEVGELGK